MNSLSSSEQILATLLLDKFDQLFETVNEIPDELINSCLPMEGSNSPVQILLHCCGMMRRWSSTVNLGIAVPRDRDAEFSAKMDKPGALALASETRTAFAADTSRTKMQQAPAVLPPGREAEYWMSTCEGVLLHVYEELCQHLGHLDITRDFLCRPAQ
ncbi:MULTISPECIES: mycothiol transferase [Glutamicibacter]|uniref:DUF664 domain-containing protein n=1 Tax=Glutamicibacter halophytocola TaxID=1933880 RepID=A0A5B8I5I8_9MICC|nr:MULTISPECIES: DUF664 domain-containing protein [Glutamicibacter]MBF6671250.1 DUF664 domain-containing protein [Glutamicibacter sp. FBE19]QDY67646.1 DUF664 domain-containing protein [Glutamicibacter halophytocola]UUX59829.1 DinB family protein [Glutamicibacter halophytocola]